MPKEKELYRHTLNLPKTSFPMRADLSVNEPKWLEQQKDNELLKRFVSLRENAKPFVLHDGPPYANGDIHIGHAVNKILKDIIIRYKAMSGFNAVLYPGWDCHGMPIELQVEKLYGRKLTTTERLNHCRQYAHEQIERQKKDFVRLGLFADWDRPYLTMHSAVEAKEIRLIGEFYQKGLLQRGLKPVNWCIDCASALAEAEVEYEDRTSSTIDVSFPCVKVPAVCEGYADLAVVIWTTTPWTLSANQAVSVHPDLSYILIRTPKGHFIIGQNLLTGFLQRCGWQDSDVEILRECRGDELDGMLLQHPFEDRVVPILLGTHVTEDSGTGLVHTAPAHGLHDYHVCLKNNIEPFNLLDDEACFKEHVPFVAGCSVRDVEDKIIDILKQNNRLVTNNKIVHSYPHCWRHKTPTIFRATPQWFICLDQPLPNSDETIRSLAIKEIEKIQFFPEKGRSRLYSMVAARPDWCLSRQRKWGVPFPFFIHKQTGELHPMTDAFVERAAQLVEEQGIEAWQSVSVDDWLGDDASSYVKSLDTVDVWFDSGLTHATVIRGSHQEVYTYPIDLYLEGSDQHRGWFHSSLLTGCALDQQTPYRQVVTHGFVVDANGYKMSKSKGNVIAPQAIINTKGADILRLWVASADYTREISLSDDVLDNVVDIYRRVRNTIRFVLANTEDCLWGEDTLPVEALLEFDKYLLAYTAQWQKKAIELYESYQFSDVVRLIYQFCSEDLGAFYLDILKDRLYSSHQHGHARRSAQTVLHYICSSLLSVCHPILPFTSDEAWQHHTKNFADYLLLHGFPQLPTFDSSEALLDKWTKIRFVRSTFLKDLESARVKHQLSTSWEAHLLLTVGDDWYEVLSSVGSDLRFVLMVASLTIEHHQEPAFIHVDITPAQGEKCGRCWHISKNIHTSEQHPGVCERCLSNINGAGEVRHYA